MEIGTIVPGVYHKESFLTNTYKMTENKDNESPITDSQETFYDKSQNLMESQMLNESQDFALIVGEGSDESTKTNSQAVENIDSAQTEASPTEKNVIETETEGIDENLITYEIDKKTPNVLTQVDATKKGEVIESLNMKDNVKDAISKEKRGSDEDEIIQGTPPEVSSPSRTLISGKRKGESLEEPAAKIQRTLPQRDALKFEKEHLVNRIGEGYIDYKSILSKVAVNSSETQSDILCENTEYIDTDDKSNSCSIQRHLQNVVIEETQDFEDSEPIVFDNPSDDENEGVENKSKESEEKDELVSEQCNPQADTSSVKPTDSRIEDAQPSQKEEDLQPSTKDDPQLNEKEEPQLNKKVDPQSSERAISENSDKVLGTRTNGEADKSFTEDNRADELMDVSEPDLTEKKTCAVEESTKNKDEGIQPADREWLNTKLPSSDSASDSNCEGGSNSSNKSRKSIELIYDRKSANQEKQKTVELVKIDEEGEEIILDSSNEELLLRFSTDSLNNSPQNTTVYKSCADSKNNSESSYQSTAWNDASKQTGTETSDCQLTNGEEQRAISDTTTKTISSGSDQLVDDLMPDGIIVETSKSAANDSDLVDKYNLSSKLSDTMELVNMVSDSDGDSLLAHENAQSRSQDKVYASSNSSAAIKTTIFEKKIRFHVEFKYLVHVDDNTKEIVCKEVTDVQCEPLIEVRATGRSDTSGSLGDISGNANKDTSPGSVISNAQPFSLPMSRFSIASTISSSSSASSAASMAAKSAKNVNFSLPKGRAKHARRPIVGAVLEEKLDGSENFETVAQGWKNAQLITDTFLQSANMVINLGETQQHDTEPNKHEGKVLSSTPEPALIREQVLSSTPEPVQDERVTSQLATPKSTKNKKPTKRSRAKSNSSTRSNGLRKASPELISTLQEDRIPMIQKKQETVNDVQSDKSAKQITISTPSRLRPDTPRKEALRSLTPQNVPNNELVGKVVFARWSDNNYYPGVVTEKTKEKFRVKFYDGKSKLLIEEFVIPTPKVLRDGLSVYATTEEDDYGSIGIILQSEDVNHVTYYTVEMDDGTRIKVRTEDIFLMPGQAQILKEEVEMESKNMPKTPVHSDGVSLDNLVDWKRRQPSTPPVTTPKSRKRSSPRASRITDSVPASGSGISKDKEKPTEISSSESDSKTTDSNISSIEDVDGVQPELETMPAAQISKGPSSRMKGRGRSRSKQTQSDIELGPIPPTSSTIFKNMSFILTSTSSDIIPRHHIDDSCSETGTENEEEWLKTPFVKERVKTQLINGGGTVYDSFKSIPPSEYKNTKLITNAPNLTAKSIQCLSVGISVYRHIWVIQCCKENKILKPSQYELPTGWSLEKNMYIESYDRLNKQPFNGMIIGMPTLDNKNVANRSIQFWRRVCENAGAAVQIIDDPGSDFSQATAILTDNRCPSWLVEKADNWEIPLVSTIWIIQCIIAGRSLSADTHPQYKHTFIQS